jgi:hypothetical protein
LLLLLFFSELDNKIHPRNPLANQVAKKSKPAFPFETNDNLTTTRSLTRSARQDIPPFPLNRLNCIQLTLPRGLPTTVYPSFSLAGASS